MKIHNRIRRTTVLGPYTRYALWLQGCEQNCPGCMSLEAKALDGGTEICVDELLNEIISCKDIEGVTISGGEPFLQAAELRLLLEKLRRQKNLGIIIYSGYYLSELRAMNDHDINVILDNYCDVLIDGPYIKELDEGSSLRGSLNQKVHLMTSRYKNLYTETYGGNNRKAEIHLNIGEAFLVGVPSAAIYNYWLKEFKRQGR